MGVAHSLLWLLAFNCAYLGLFAFVPFSIGSSVVAAARRYVDAPAFTLLSRVVPTNIVSVLREISVTAAQVGFRNFRAQI